MSDLTAAGSAAAKVLLDAVSGGFGMDTAGDVDATHLALQRLHDLEVVTAVFDEESGAVRVDVSDLTGAALLLVMRLVAQLAESTGSPRDVVLHDLRQWVDQLEV